jgi:photosystem II stability/assembly factor-like uncharacterized protein
VICLAGLVAAGLGGGSAAAYQPVLEAPAAASPLAARTLLNGITRAGPRLIAVGQRGHVLYSDDEGRTWKQASVPVSTDLVAVSFPSARRGWAVGHDGVVLQTVDGGVTWKNQLSDAAALLGAERSLLDVWFEDEASGFVVGAFNVVLRTTDGGKTWQLWSDRTENPKLLHLYAVRRIGADVFIAGEQGLLLKLDRKAGRFHALSAPYRGTFFGLTGKPGAVIAFGLRGNAVRSADGGATWERVATGVRAGLTASTLTDDGRIVLVSQEGQAIVSADGGATFAPARLQRAIPVSAVACAGAGALALAGVLGVSVQPLE